MILTAQGSSGEAPSLSRKMAQTLALEAGFSEAGVTAVPQDTAERDAERFEQWVRAGKAGTMQYLKRTEEGTGEGRMIRSRIGLAFPWAKSAIVCFSNYESGQPRSINPAAEGTGWIARYAWSSRRDASGVQRPSDYHKVLKKRLQVIEARMRVKLGKFEARGFVDTGPVVERSIATAAGIGWTGKNTCLIHPKLGSFGFLAVLLTSLPVEEETAQLKPLPDRCGTCTRCLDACPTGALIAPYQMDARRCIAYLTIEHRDVIEPELMEGMGRQVFGCDICQDVCPWNRKAPIGSDAELLPRTELVNPALEWLAEMDEETFEKHFNGSPVRRAGFNGLRRNLAIAIANSGAHSSIDWLRKWQQSTDAGLRTAAQWALARLQQKDGTSRSE